MDVAQSVLRLTQRKWAWRTFLTLVFLVPVLLVLPHTRSLVVRNAVTTAYLGDIKAPISGQIESIQVAPGAVAQAGTSAISLRNDRADRSELARLEVQAEELGNEVERQRARLESLRTLAVSRHAELDAFVAAVAQELGKRLQQAEDDVPALAAELKAATATLDRARNLNRTTLLSTADLEAAEAAYEGARAANSRNQLEIKRLKQQQNEALHGVFQIDVPDGILLTRQLVQQLDQEVRRLEHEVHASETEWKAVVAERQALEKLASADVELPPGVTVWSVYVTQGAWVSEGAALLSIVDCTRLMADIAVDDATLELIQPGQAVRMRLFGSFDYFTGKVVLVRGSAGLNDTPVLAAQVQHRGDRQGRVLARLDPSPLSGQPQNSCAIGRTMYAEFEGIGLLATFLYPLFR